MSAVFLFVGSLAYTLTNMREELSDVLYNDDTLGDFGIAGLGLGVWCSRAHMDLGPASSIGAIGYILFMD